MWKIILWFCLGVTCLAQSGFKGRTISVGSERAAEKEILSLSLRTIPEALNRIIQAKTSRQAEKLGPVFQKESSPDILHQAILAVGQIGDPKALNWVRPYLEHKEHQSIALFAWGECGGFVSGSTSDSSETGNDRASQHSLSVLLEVHVFKGNELMWFEAVSKLASENSIFSDEMKKTVLEAWQGYSDETKDDALFYAWRFEDAGFEEEVLSSLSQGHDSYGLIYFAYRKKMVLSSGIFGGLVEKRKTADPDELLKLLQCQVQGVEEHSGVIKGFLNHPDWRVRVEAVKLLSRSKLLDADQTHLLDDPNHHVVRAFLSEFLKEGGLDKDTERQLIRRWKRLSPALKWTVLQSLSQIDQKWLLLEMGNWLHSKVKWKRLKGITCLGKTGSQRRDKDDHRLSSYFNTGSGLERLVAYTGTKHMQKSWFKEALFSKDPFLMAVALESISDVTESEKVALSEEEWQRLAERLLLEPDIQYYTLKPLEKIISSSTYEEILTGLLSSPHYLVRLKAAEALAPADRSPVFSSAWQNGMPEIYSRAAASLLTLDESRYWHIVTEKGNIVIQLFLKDAPVTCTSIMELSRKKYFNGMAIHRVVPDFVLQAGDPRGDGSGGPGYTIPCEINTRKYERGSVGMALAGKDTGGSQFFVCHSAQPHLDGGYTVFGRVVQGMPVVDFLEEGNLIISSSIKSELTKRTQKVE